jgi:Pectate lyase superfamily protein
MRKTNSIVPTCLLLCAAATGYTQTQIDLGRQGKSPDFAAASATRPVKTGSVLPATCSTGELYFKTDAPAGRNLYGCTATNTWTPQSLMLWGTITGTLSNQTDLQSALSGKANTSHVHSDADVPDTISLTNITQIANRSHTSLTDVGTNTHSQIDTHLGAATGVHGITGSVVGTSDAQTLTNKVLTDANVTLQDDVDNTKRANFQLSSISSSATRSYILPNGSTTLVGTDLSQTLSAKVLTTPVISGYTMATLPAPGTANRVAIVTDAATTGSCTTGGGTARAWCRDTGTAWEPLGGGAGGSGYPTIQDEATSLTQRATVNFTGAGVTCADDAGNSRTNCTISGSGDAGLVYNVKAYGAVGNYTTDDTAAIQAAIDAAAAAPAAPSWATGGGVVYFPPGSYRITSPLTLKSGVTLRGASDRGGAAEIVAGASMTAVIQDQGVAAETIHAGIEDLGINGDVKASYGLWLRHTSFSNFLRMRILFTKTYGINGSSGNHNKFEKIHVISCNEGVLFGQRMWQPGTVYAASRLVIPTANGILHMYEATTGGTSGASEPTWPTTPGQTVVDGTVTWTCRDFVAFTNSYAEDLFMYGPSYLFTVSGTTVTIAGADVTGSLADSDYVFTQLTGGSANIMHHAIRRISNIAYSGGNTTLTIDSALGDRTGGWFYPGSELWISGFADNVLFVRGGFGSAIVGNANATAGVWSPAAGGAFYAPWVGSGGFFLHEAAMIFGTHTDYDVSPNIVTGTGVGYSMLWGIGHPWAKWTYQAGGNGFTYASLPGNAPVGAVTYCTDCTVATTCAAGGTGATATRLNGVWTCGGGGGGGTGTELTISGTLSAANSLVKSAGVGGRAVSETGCSIDASNKLSCPGGYAAGDGSVAGEMSMSERTANGSEYVSWLAPDALTNTLRLRFPNTSPTAGQVMSFGAPSGGISDISFVTPAAASSRSESVYIKFGSCRSDDSINIDWSVPTSNGPTATSCSNGRQGMGTFADGANIITAYAQHILPPTWDSSSAVDATLYFQTTYTASANVVLDVTTACISNNESRTPTYNTLSSQTVAVSDDTVARSVTFSNLSMTSCAPGEFLILRIRRNSPDAADTSTAAIHMWGVLLKYKVTD